MPSLYDSPELTTAQNTATSAQSDYLNSAQADITLPDLLKKALNDKFTNNNPLIQDLNTARTNYLNTTTSAPLSVMPENNNGIIFNPAQQADLINQRKTAALSPVMLLNDLLGIQTGGIQNIIDSASRASQAATLGKKAKADTAQTAYSNLLDLITKKQSEKEFNMNYDLALKNLALDQTGGTAGAAMRNLTTDVQAGMKLGDALRKYKPFGLTPDEIYQEYQTSSKWGKDNSDVNTLSQLGITKGAAGQFKYASNDPDFKTISSALDTLATDRKGTSIMERLNPTSPTGIKINSQKNILTQILAKLVEKNRLSDADRKFYLSQMPQAWMNDSQAQAAIDGIKTGLASALGLLVNPSTNDTRPPLSSFDK